MDALLCALVLGIPYALIVLFPRDVGVRAARPNARGGWYLKNTSERIEPQRYLPPDAPEALAEDAD